MIDLENTRRLLESSDDMPELRKNLCFTLIKEVELKEKKLKALQEKLEWRQSVNQWFRYNDWLGDLVKNTTQVLVIGSAVIALCVGGLGLTIYTVRVMNPPEDCGAQ